ncbi:hypothetical protein [Soonwooa sp.]|uniref:hypothetical protein n=1 Tax=Soonwooa sp. TaxID=1938592 RepID=UPI002624CCE6|nr:hypothetical protein [Soonwooa sp.]
MTKQLLKISSQKNILILASLSILFSFMSCETVVDNLIDNIGNNHQQNNYTSRYMGNWVGTYAGPESGNVAFKVSKDGTIYGNYGTAEEVISGSVLDDGGLLSVLSVKSGFHLYANLNQNSGTWKKGDITGTWTFKKQ